MSDDAPDAPPVWTFAFGSNMNIPLLRTKKLLTVLEHAPAVARGWRLNFSAPALAYVEPSFADAQRGSAEDCIHGVAVLLPAESYARLARQEASYADPETLVTTYAGRVLTARIFSRPASQPGAPDIPCSARYLDVLVRGAREAGLQPAYVAALAALPTYAPSAETLARRAALLPPPRALAAVTVAELRERWADAPRGSAQPSDALARTAVLGYVLELPRSAIAFGAHRGRDTSARALRQFRGQPLDEGDDLGAAAAFPALAAALPPEREFVAGWLDHYLSKGARVVGYLAEFLAASPPPPGASEGAGAGAGSALLQGAP